MNNPFAKHSSAHQNRQPRGSIRTIAVLFGGRSVEHEISIITALQMMQAMDTLKFDPVPVYVSTDGRWYTGTNLLDRNWYRNLPANFSKVTEVTLLPKPGTSCLTVIDRGRADGNVQTNIIPIDVFFPCFHGTYGEDGAFQGLFEIADVAYTGCDVISASTGMSKYHCKQFLAAHNIPVLPSTIISKQEMTRNGGRNIDAIRMKVLTTPGLESFPLFVKPASLGSSIGTSRVSTENELDAALVQALNFDTQVIIEPCLDEKMEINVSVCGGSEIKSSVVEIPIASAGLLSYEDKYLRGGGSKSAAPSQGMASLGRLINPQNLDSTMKSLARSTATEAYSKLGCSGVARIDFIVDLKSNTLYFNEINTLPGSLAYYLWCQSDPCVLYTDLITDMIDQALKRKAERTSLKRNIGFAALFKN